MERGESTPGSRRARSSTQTGSPPSCAADVRDLAKGAPTFSLILALTCSPARFLRLYRSTSRSVSTIPLPLALALPTPRTRLGHARADSHIPQPCMRMPLILPNHTPLTRAAARVERGRIKDATLLAPYRSTRGGRRARSSTPDLLSAVLRRRRSYVRYLAKGAPPGAHSPPPPSPILSLAPSLTLSPSLSRFIVLSRSLDLFLSFLLSPSRTLFLSAFI
jgi:hypothetical protein